MYILLSAEGDSSTDDDGLRSDSTNDDDDGMWSDCDSDAGLGDAESGEPNPKSQKTDRGFGAACLAPGRKKKMGRPAYRDIYPLSAMVQQILSCHSGGADRGRSETTNYTTLTLKELTRRTRDTLRQYCLDFGLPLPKKFPSTKTVRRLGKAPNPRYRTAYLYKNVVPFRTAPRNNDDTPYHEDFHFTAATVKMFNELACYFEADCVFYSCDNKNKVRFGARANVNTTRPRGMFLEWQKPSMPDHSFPTKNAHIVPMGYMHVHDLMRSRNLSGSNKGRFR